MRYVIITGGPLPVEAADVIRGYAGEPDTKIIACDSGCDFLSKISIIPSVVIGDMDSITVEGIELISANNIPVEKYPVEKDWTDTEIALMKTDISDEVILVCPVAGRIDHVIANLGLVIKYRSEGWKITVTDGITVCLPLSGEDRAECSVRSYNGEASVSLIPCSFDTPVTGVTTEGLYYPLTDATLTAGSSFSFSNHPVEGAKMIAVSIKSGKLLLVVTKAV